MSTNRTLSEDIIAAVGTGSDPAVLDVLEGVTVTSAQINAVAGGVNTVVAIGDAATYTVLAANSGKVHIFPNLTASCTATLPAAAAGLNYKFIYGGVATDAQNWRIEAVSAPFLGGVVWFDLNGGAAGDEVAVVNPNGSSNDFLTVTTPGSGTYVEVYCNGTNWYMNGMVISDTVPAFADT